MDNLAGALSFQDLRSIVRNGFIPSDPSDPEDVLNELLLTWKSNSSIPDLIAHIEQLVNTTQLKTYQVSEAEITSLKLPVSAPAAHVQLNNKELEQMNDLQAEVSLLSQLIDKLPTRPRKATSTEVDQDASEVETARETLRRAQLIDHGAECDGRELKEKLQVLLMDKIVNSLPKTSRKYHANSAERLPSLAHLDEQTKFATCMGIIRKLAPQDQQAFLQRLSGVLSSSRN